MKKILITSFLSSLLIIGCKKNTDTVLADETQKENTPLSQSKTLGEVKKALMENILYLSKVVPMFRKTIEDECLKQVRGDYNVALDKIIESNEKNHFFTAKQSDGFISLVNDMKKIRQDELPIIFVPVMESRDPKIKSNRISASKDYNSNNSITMVDQDDDVDKILKPSGSDKGILRYNENQCYPGYIISDGVY